MGIDQVIGQEQIKDYIKKAVKKSKVSHAYILCGEKGTGRMALAKLFAASLQCMGNTGAEDFKGPCGECRSCRQMQSGNQPDVITVTQEKKTGIGIDEIRYQVNNSVTVKPYAGPYKVYIIPNADKMTEQAQNALLKTIEEPPEYVVIILIAENASAFLPTILSRCVLLNMKPVSEAVITKYLIDSCKLPDYAAHSCAVFAQGNIGKAVRYAADGDFMELMNNVIRVLRSLDSKRTDELAGVVKHIKEEHFDIDDYLDIMILWYRDVLLYKAVKDNNMLIFRDEVKYIAADAKVRSYENIEKSIKAIEKAKIRLNANVNFDITIELLLITLKEIW